MKELDQQLANNGYKSSIVSIQRLPDLQRNLEDLLEKEILSKNFYHEIVSRYNLFFDFIPPADFLLSQSIIITAAIQPKVSVKFNLSNKTFVVIIPPTYMDDTDREVSRIVSLNLQKYGYKIYNAKLPLKLLAAHSGLANYGKNNLAYIDGWGSFFKLKAFFSDMPSIEDNWYEVRMMESCDKCVACINKCPTSAIRQDRFLITAEKCLTFFNEKSDNFPGWVNLNWHNCLIGCMACQDACPVNKENTKHVVPGGEFLEEETLMILKGNSKDKLPLETIEKLKKLCLLDDYNILQRNLEVLIRKNGIRSVV
ncbi:MAG TPA: FeS-binding protein [Candidatus Atribacteria bacterium]|nr:FeS-binding protein [Candidatus Atribacteria bacterium]